MRRIVFTADKGGVGKTTTVANVAVRLGELGKRVLVVDVDGQGDVTYAILATRPPLMEHGKTVSPSMYALMVEQAEFSDVVIKAPKYPNIQVLPSNTDLDRAPPQMASEPGGTTVLKRVLDSLPVDAYDYVLIDTAKGRDTLLINSVAAADDVVVMTTPGKLEVDAVARTMTHVSKVRTKTLMGADTDRPQVVGVLMTRAKVLADETVETVTVSARRLLEESHPGLVFETVIPEADDFKKAISLATSIFEYEERKHKPETGDKSRYTVRGRKLAEVYELFVKELMNHGR